MGVGKLYAVEWTLGAETSNFGDVESSVYSSAEGVT